MMNVHVQEIAIVDGLGRQVELICHDEMSGDANLEARCWCMHSMVMDDDSNCAVENHDDENDNDDEGHDDDHEHDDD